MPQKVFKHELLNEIVCSLFILKLNGTELTTTTDDDEDDDFY
jgi:hypothetical protein